MAYLYSILDTKSNMYGPIISFQNDSTAMRSFTEMIVSGDQNSLLSLYPADYILFCLGNFEQSDGLISPLNAPQLVITGTEAVTRAIDEVNRRRLLRKALDVDSVQDIPLASAPIDNAINAFVNNNGLQPTQNDLAGVSNDSESSQK
ncbi:nonstructural protein [Sigmofec virus UA08Rod_6110]|uniref:Nonstructural protein n=1 Tax=Sigmofec virus UA08Rod_6110 TaxID=2929452 RepID=A0A976N142_9VIRU|nr:nonstructural protein [Sigmofec virus UA08Rod_6110]